jgi:acetyl esterase/lipase
MPHSLCRCLPNIQYANNTESRQCMDIYLPLDADAGPFPVILNIHGGGWWAGDKGALSGEAHLVDNGFVLVRLNYRYSTQAPYPAQLEDLHTIVRWLHANKTELNLDMDRLFCIGHSAGGHLASILAMTADQTPDISIRACVNQAGGTDLVYAVERRRETGVITDDKPNTIETMLGCKVSENPEKAVQASPIAYVRPDAPPHLLIYGEKDTVVPAEQGRRFHEAMQKVGGRSEIHILAGADHVHPSFWQTENFERILRFYRSCF